MITANRELIERTLRFLETHGAHGKEGVGLMDELRGVLSREGQRPMTDEQIYAAIPDDNRELELGEWVVFIVRAVEAFHGIK